MQPIQQSLWRNYIVTENFIDGSGIRDCSSIRAATPETFTLAIKDELGRIAGIYLAQIRVGGVSSSLLLDLSSVITTIRKSDAERIRQFSKTAVFEEKECLSNWTGVNNAWKKYR